MDDGDLTLTGGSGDELGFTLTSGSDLDGDGLNDILAVAPYAGRHSEVYVVPGSTTGTHVVEDVATAVLTSSSGAVDVANACGDVDGDGHGDVLVIDAAATVQDGVLQIGWVGFGPFAGSVVLNGAGAHLIQSGGTTDRIDAAEGVGDLNDDGFSDLLIGDMHASGSEGAAWVLYGGAG